MADKESGKSNSRRSSDKNHASPVVTNESSNTSSSFDAIAPSFEAQMGKDLSAETFERHSALLGDPSMSQRMYDGQRSAIVQRLQSEYGNGYVQRLVDDISSKKTQGIQPKLSVGAAGDRYEQEADRVAKDVVNGLNSTQSGGEGAQRVHDEVFGHAQRRMQMQREAELARRKAVEVQPQIGEEGGDVSSDVNSTIESSRGNGKELPGGIRSQMEGAFGADFGGVRVHTGSQADSLNRSMSARAFTTGSDIFFAKGEYNPGNKGGQETLAHELTHVVQQTGGRLARKEDDAVQATPAADESVQREFGFEVEVPIFISYTDPAADDQSIRNDAMDGTNGGVVPGFSNSPNFDIKVDHNLELDGLAGYENQLNGGTFDNHASIIELVTKPWDELALTSKDVKNRAKEMVDWVKDVRKAVNIGQFSIGNGFYIGSDSDDAKALQTTMGYIQATYGVKLSSVPDLIDQTVKVNPEAKEHENLIAAKAVGPQVMLAISLADDGWDEAIDGADSKSLEGYVILLANYLIAGGSAGAKIGLGKNTIGEYFYKTDMGKLSNMLPVDVYNRLGDESNGSINALYEELLDVTDRKADEDIIQGYGIKVGNWVETVMWGGKDELLAALINEYSAELGPDVLGANEDDQEYGVVMENRELQYLDPKFKKKQKKHDKELDKYYDKVAKSKGAQSQQQLAKGLANMTDPKKWPTNKWQDMFMRVYAMVRQLNS